MNRSNRRRINRRKERINLLREIFKDEINKIDSSFYYRLDNLFYHNEDRSDPFDYTLFNDSHYSDSQYYKEYPTIYHLRKELIESDEKADIRKIYLAMHHMIKYRGNFLSDQENFSTSNIDDLKKYFDILNAYSNGEYSLEFNNYIFDKLVKVNKTKLTMTGKKEKYIEILNPSNNDKYNFEKLIREYNLKNNSELKKESIEEYVNELSYVSPGMKRPMIQAYKIIEEVEKILNHRIDEYYVECTRGNDNGKKGKETKSRKEIIQEFYNQLLKNNSTSENDKKRVKELKQKADSLDKSSFQGEKLYLYFTQLGRCMYSGDIIDFEDLNDNSKYDVDHIYPQSLIKDDSIMNNKVLVKQDLNRRKSNTYPIPSDILWNGNSREAYKFYKFLKENHFITEEKYNRLTKIELSDSEYDTFVNRQIVYTNQAVKCLIEAIKTLKSTDNFVPKVVYSKSKNVTDFRHKYNLLKSRNINNFHHAHDAYLNIIVGRTIDHHFSYYQNKYHGNDYIKQMCNNHIPVNVLKIFDQNKNNSKTDILDKDNHLIWSYSNSLKEINHNIYERFDIFSTERTYTKNTILKSVTIYPAGKANIPVNRGKLSDYKKYGGLQNVSYGLYLLVNYDDKYRVVAVPTMYKNNDLEKKEYLSKLLRTTNFNITISELKINTVIETGKKKFVFTGKDSETSYCICNKIERIFSKKEIIIIKKIEKVVDKIGKDKINQDNIKDKGMYYEDDNSLVVYFSKNKEDYDKNIEYKSNILTNAEMLYVYDEMISRLKKECFSYNATSTILNTIISKKEEYIKLSIIDKCVLFMELLNFMKCNSTASPNLSLIGGSSKPHKMNYPTTLKDCRIVFESVTGFYRKEFKID